MIKENNRQKIFCPFEFWQRCLKEKALISLEKLDLEKFSDLYLKVMSGLIRFIEPSDDKIKQDGKLVGSGARKTNQDSLCLVVTSMAILLNTQI